MTSLNRARILCALIMVAGSFSHLLGQGTAAVAVSATVVTPIAIVKNIDMNFGNAAVAVASGGIVVLSPAGTRSAAGSGVTLPATAGTVAAAKFTVSGAPTYTYSITLPASVVISGPGATSMTVNDFTSAPAASGTLSATGSQTLWVGASLNIAGAQAPGSYTNVAAAPITVNYN